MRDIGRQGVGLAVTTFFLGVLVAAVVLTLSRRVRPAPIVIVPPAPTPTAAPTATAAPILVNVAGAVARPDMYWLPAGARVADALAAAGGTTAAADLARVNPAQLLHDGMGLYVPRPDEAAPVITVGGDGRDEPVGPININSADAALLEQLAGIGPSTAAKIITYREENGPFAAIEEITNVSGIGPATFERIQDQITVGS